MINRFRTALPFALIAVSCVGCSHPDAPAPNMNSSERMANLARTIQDDPSSSSDAKRFAAGIAKQADTDKDVGRMMQEN